MSVINNPLFDVAIDCGSNIARINGLITSIRLYNPAARIRSRVAFGLDLRRHAVTSTKDAKVADESGAKFRMPTSIP